jgi:hypothetical protein
MRYREEPIQADKGDAGIIERAIATSLLVIDDIDRAKLTRVSRGDLLCHH